MRRFARSVSWRHLPIVAGLLAGTAAQGTEALSVPAAALAAPGPQIVMSARGAVRPHLALGHPRPTPADHLRPRLADCLPPAPKPSRRVDLRRYAWPGTRDVAGHEICLFAIFTALDGPRASGDWVRAVIAPRARPDCPARWNVARPSPHGMAVLHVWRERLGTPLFVDVLDRAARWSDDLRAPVHSSLRTTFDGAGKLLMVKYERFTLGQPHGLARCP